MVVDAFAHQPSLALDFQGLNRTALNAVPFISWRPAKIIVTPLSVAPFTKRESQENDALVEYSRSAYKQRKRRRSSFYHKTPSHLQLMSAQLSNEQRFRAALSSNSDSVVSHGLAHPQPQNFANIYYFSKGGEDVFDAVVQDHEDRVVFRFANIEEAEETRVYGTNDKVVAVIDWDVHLQPVLKYGGEEIKLKKWIARVPGNT